MKKIIYLFLIIFLFSCTHYIYNMRNIKNETYNKNQVDSICLAENIPMLNDEYWIKTFFINEDDKNIIYQYMYIQRKNNIEKTYICTFDKDSIFKFTVRQLEKIKK